MRGERPGDQPRDPEREPAGGPARSPGAGGYEVRPDDPRETGSDPRRGAAGEGADPRVRPRDPFGDAEADQRAGGLTAPGGYTPAPAEAATSPYLQPALAAGLLERGDAPGALARDAGASPPRRRRRRGSASLIPTYFRYPPLKPSHWRWLVICYFFVGGIAGFSQALAALATLDPRSPDRHVVRTGRYLALAGAASAPIFLTLDLHLPQRFHHMLRIFKSRSAMSVGSWVLTAFGLASGLLGAKQMANDGLLPGLPVLPALARRIPDKAIAPCAGALGLAVASYTGVLLSATNVPVWAAQAPLLGPLFLASAASTSTAALRLAALLSRPASRGGCAGPSTGRGESREPGAALERFEAVSAVAELSLLAAALAKGGAAARPLVGGPLAIATAGAASGAAAPLVMRLAFGNRRAEPRGWSIGASVATLAGGFLLRTAYVLAGRDSAESPEDYFRYTGA